MTLAADPRRGSVPSRSGAQPRDTERPVEFWSTSAIRSALETGDIAIWQRIVVALKRDPYGRTAHQVEEVLDDAQPDGIAKALLEVLARTRAHLDTDERAEVARQLQLLVQRSGLSQREFASRTGVPSEDLADYLNGTTSPPASLMVRMQRLSDRFVNMRTQRSIDSD